MSVVSCVTYRDRIERILEKTRGKSALSEWEYQRLNEWLKSSWLTHRQVGIIDKISSRVLGEES